MAQLRAEHRENATWLQSLVDRMVKVLRRPQVVVEISILIAGWVAFNLGAAALGLPVIDPPPFAWLCGATILISATGVTSMRKIWDTPPTPARCSTLSLKSRRLKRRDQALDPISPHFVHDAK